MWRQGRLGKGCCFLVLLPDRGLGACGKCCGCRGEDGGYTMVTSPFESSDLKRKVGGFNHQTSAPRMLPLGCQPQCAQGMGKRQPWAWSLHLSPRWWLNTNIAHWEAGTRSALPSQLHTTESPDCSLLWHHMCKGHGPVSETQCKEHVCRRQSCRCETACALCTSYCSRLGFGRSARLMQADISGCNCKKYFPLTRLPETSPLGTSCLSRREAFPTHRPHVLQTPKDVGGENPPNSFTLCWVGRSQVPRTLPGLPNPLQKDAAQPMSDVMEAPHAQKSPGGVWCSAPAPQEVHTVHTLLHSSRMQSASAAGWCSSSAAFVLPHGRWLQCPPFVLCHTAVRCPRSSNKLTLSPAVTMRLKSQLAQGDGPDSYAVLSDQEGCLPRLPH